VTTRKTPKNFDGSERILEILIAVKEVPILEILIAVKEVP
jgi:hypothetical protein